MAVVSCSDAAKVFEAAKETFDFVPSFVDRLRVSAFFLAKIFARRDDGFCAALADKFSQIVAVVAFVGDDMSGLGRFGQTVPGWNVIADVPSRHFKNNGASFIVRYGMNLRVFSATR